MIELPDTGNCRIVNEVLKPYFSKIEKEIRSLRTFEQYKRFTQYRIYLEKEAKKSRMAVRMQIRINLAALKEQLSIDPVPEINVQPKMSTRACFSDGRFYEVSASDLGLGFHT
jgi:hypothetical protein